ncbi:hypothetical protein [Microbacterium aurum]
MHLALTRRSPTPRRTGQGFVLVVAAIVGLAACSSSPNPSDRGEGNNLSSYLGTPLEEFPGIADDVYVLSLTQDVRFGSIPRPANQVAPTEPGWVIVGLCADTPTIDPQRTKNVVVRVVAEEFIDDHELNSIEDGGMQNGVVCGNAAPIAPIVAAG